MGGAGRGWCVHPHLEPPAHLRVHGGRQGEVHEAAHGAGREARLALMQRPRQRRKSLGLVVRPRDIAVRGRRVGGGGAKSG